MEYLQLVAAGAVDRTRKQAAAAVTKAGTSWTTGWRDDAGDGTAGPDHTPGAAAPAAVDGPAASASSAPAAPAVAVDDGYRNTTEFLRARLRIGAAEARRRLSLAGSLLPRQGFAGEPLPPVHGELGSAVAAGEVASRAATIITLALERVRHVCDADAADRMEHALTRTAVENDPDFLARVARSWTDALDQDGAEPSEELLRQLQGAFIRKPRHGLQHLEIFATAEQFEYLLTVMNTATNPRTSAPEAAETGAAGEGSVGRHMTAAMTGGGRPAGSAHAAAETPRRARRRRQGRPRRRHPACRRRTPPAGHGHHRLPRPARPARHTDGDLQGTATDLQGTARGPFRPGATTEHTGNLLFTGPVTASTVRKIACDADIIPVLLGSEGRILDIGRTSRVFPPHIRKALTARDQGCAFPGCTIPATWCEAHHIDLLVPRRHNRHRKRRAALLTPPPRDPQRTLDHPGTHRHPLVHPATPPRPTPKTQTQLLLPPRRPRHRSLTRSRQG